MTASVLRSMSPVEEWQNPAGQGATRAAYKDESQAYRSPLSGASHAAHLRSTPSASDIAPGDYYDSADAHMLTICVIEEERALTHVDAIAATQGVDVIFIGTSDLSFSLGLRGRQNEPKLHEAIDTIIAAAQRNHKFLGRPAGSAEEVFRYHQQGFQVFQSVTELGLMRLGAKQILQPLGINPSSTDENILY